MEQFIWRNEGGTSDFLLIGVDGDYLPETAFAEPEEDIPAEVSDITPDMRSLSASQVKEVLSD
ncbi:hypothetical protein KIN20_022498 [Parelaphostrongylus tenuis]|uniref:Uncharacterized protein n=1 Tax=Parelaphostrongylus tenuis TaxID=148309 RepID=A0AAD5MUA5_PARTN|nr:hypothetical protein KIN20_022498 [Parelaphostrongylus tenuis]